MHAWTSWWARSTDERERAPDPRRRDRTVSDGIHREGPREAAGAARALSHQTGSAAPSPVAGAAAARLDFGPQHDRSNGWGGGHAPPPPRGGGVLNHVPPTPRGAAPR